MTEVTDDDPVSWSAIAGGAIVSFTILLGGITAAGGWRATYEFLSSSAASGWVQAVGSIGAICGAIWVMDSQQRRETYRHAEEARAAKRHRLKTLLALFTYVARICRYASESANRDDTAWAIHAQMLTEGRSRLLSIPPLEIPSISLQIALQECVDRLLICSQMATHAAGLPTAQERAKWTDLEQFFFDSKNICLAGASEVFQQLVPISSEAERRADDLHIPSVKERLDELAKLNAQKFPKSR